MDVTSPDQILPAGPGEAYPQSFPQEFFCSIDEGDSAGSFNSTFCIVDGWRIRGGVDLDALSGALDDLVVRHELLRTVVDRGEEPRYQRIYPPCPVPFEVIEHPSVPADERDVMADELLKQAEDTRVDPGRLPVLRAALHRFDADDAVLIMVVHHVFSDHWTIAVLIRDLAACYAARTGDAGDAGDQGTPRAPELPPVRQYREYTEWESAEYARRDAAGAKEYWREKLRDARTFVLPKDPGAADGPVPNYAMYSFFIPAEEASRVSAYARRMRCSNFMVLISVFYVLAQRISGNGDLTIRTLMAGRDEVRFQDTVGPFLNLLPLRTDITGCAGFDEVVRRVRSSCLEAYSMALPFQRLLEAVPELIAEETEPGKTPFLFEMVQSQLPGEAPLIGRSLTEIRTYREGLGPAADIPSGQLWNMNLAATGELDVVVLFNLEEFEPDTVKEQIESYRRLLAELIGESVGESVGK